MVTLCEVAFMTGFLTALVVLWSKTDYPVLPDNRDGGDDFDLGPIPEPEPEDELVEV